MEPVAPPALGSLTEADDKDLRLLSILHTVYGCVNLLGILILWVVKGFAIRGIKVIEGLSEGPPFDPAPGAEGPSTALDRETEDLLSGRIGPSLFEPQLLLIIGLSICLGCLLYFWSASCLKGGKRVWVVYAASLMALLNVPIGLALGIFTIVVIRRPGVAALFSNR